METKRYLSFALLACAIGAVSFSGCSSSELQDDEASLPMDDLPVVDANTDALPNSLEDMPEGADQLMPEALVEVPDGQDAEAAALTEQIAATEELPPEADMGFPTEAPADNYMADTGPSMDAPPSMNEVAPPVAYNEFSDDSASMSAGGNSTYEVQAGDTLMKVAYRVYGDLYRWRKIYQDNQDRISDPSQLVAGTQLRVDHPAQEEDFNGYERYLIKNGDTLGTISNDVYGTTAKWKRLWQENDRLIKDPNRIYAGFLLRYSFTEQDRMEKDRRHELQQDPQPLAGAMDESGREPTSAQAPNAEVVPQN